ncbi:MAG: ornithine cyclodeaminase family domain [Pyrinomonadaceae bacterium]
MSIYDLKPLSLDKVKTYPLAARPSKVTVEDFAAPITETASLREYLSSLPNILAVQNLRDLAAQMRRARELKKPIIWGIGGHVIKTGLAPVMIDLMKRGFLTAVAANGSVLVHDAEIAMVGSTSEDVDATLGEGVFGGADETGKLLNAAAAEGARESIGLGEALGNALVEMKPRHEQYSLLCAAYRSKVPFTVFITIGGDIAHFHPAADGAALGATSHTDFRLLAEIVRRMNGGGVYINIGSAVTLPEVFLKCVTLVRNLGHELTDITTANFDFIQSYRPLTNVVRRPTADGAGRGFAITGHHELTIPLLAAELISGAEAK